MANWTWPEEAQAEIDCLTRERDGEREAREKSDAALRGKDKAMGEIIAYCHSKGVDLSHFFS